MTHFTPYRSISSHFILSYLPLGVTTDEITQTYQLSQNSMDDFYFAETPNCSQASQNSQVSSNSLTVDTNFDSDGGHTNLMAIVCESATHRVRNA